MTYKLKNNGISPNLIYKSFRHFKKNESSLIIEDRKTSK